MSQLEVKTSKLQFVMAVLLGLFFVPFSLWSLVNAVLKGFEIVPLMLGLMMLAIFGLVIWVFFRGYFKSVKHFTDEGLVRNDGRKFSWAELSRVVNQIRFDTQLNRTLLWRTEIQFKNGESAWVIPTKVSNFQEVREFVNDLPCEHTEVNV